jgi:outer membrane receptor protein involved in Fe transport
MRLKSLLAASSASIVALSLLSAAPAFAQQQTDETLGTQADPAPANADGSDSDGEQTVVVTGSRIARPEIEAAVPVAVVGREQLAQEGATNVQDILNELPQVGIGVSRTNSNFSTAANGVATINLRNLGSARTLVLVNGRRFVAGLAGSSAVDVNNIPTDFLERVEVTTGGGSAVYGSDAVSGVVNFVLRDKFEGIQARGQYGITERGDNARYSFSVTGGESFGPDDAGNVLLNFTYDKDEGLLSRQRSISDQDCFLNPEPEGPLGCGPAFYSTFAAQGRFQFLDSDGAPVPGTIFTFDRNNNLVSGFPTGSGFNRNAERRISVPVERYLASGIANYDITPNIEVFVEGTYAKVKSSSQIEPFALNYTDIFDGSAAQGNGISITNPFIPASIRAAITARNSDADPTNDVASLGFRRRQNEVFDRSNTNDRDTYRAVAGIRGEITSNFDFEASYTYGRLKDFTASEDIDNARYRNALDAEIGPDGQPRCRSAAARAEGCVPINLFGFNTASQAASAYVQACNPEIRGDHNEQHVVSGSITGTIPLFAAGPLGIAVGAEYRKEKSRDDLDELTNTGGNSGNQIPDTVGSFNVKEVFGELDIPLLADRPFFHDFRLRGAARYSDYSTIGGVFSWNAGAEWSPIAICGSAVSTLSQTAHPMSASSSRRPAETFPGSSISDPCEGVTATSTGTFDAACRAIRASTRSSPATAHSPMSSPIFRASTALMAATSTWRRRQLRR